MAHINFKIFHPDEEGTFYIEQPFHESPESNMPVKEGKPVIRMPRVEETLARKYETAKASTVRRAVKK